VYLDVEPYHRTSTNTGGLLAFVSGWTSQLHADGYVSGVYGASSLAIADLASRWGTGYPEPDDVWFAEWNGQPTASSSDIPASYWSDLQRLHQYTGSRDETYGGAALNVDDDYVGGATAGVSLLPPLLGPRPIAPVLLAPSGSGSNTTRQAGQNILLR
jgi:hypothetical protein